MTVPEDWDGERLDLFLAKKAGDGVSRALVQKWIKSGYIREETGKVLNKPSFAVQSNQSISVRTEVRPTIGLSPVKMDIPIVEEFPEYMVINKPAGISSHAGPGDSEPSLVNGLLYHFRQLSGAGGTDRPGIVHRLDKPTSGLMLIAKSDRAHFLLAEMFQKREIQKIYYAWLLQSPREQSGLIDQPIGRHKTERLKNTVRPDGRKAITRYKIIKTIPSKKNRNFTLAEIKLETGRTHQIRVHFQHLGCPVVGDHLYSRSEREFSKFGLLLYSAKLTFKDPFDKTLRSYELQFPENFVRFEKEAINH